MKRNQRPPKMQVLKRKDLKRLGPCVEEEVVGEAIEKEPKATEDAGVEKEGPKTVGDRIHGREALCIQSSRTR